MAPYAPEPMAEFRRRSKRVSGEAPPLLRALDTGWSAQLADAAEMVDRADTRCRDGAVCFSVEYSADEQS